MQPEHKKLILALVLVVGAVAVYFKFSSSPSPLANSIRFVDVATGKEYRIARDEVPSIFPAKCPDTGQLTLLPVVEENGKLYVTDRHAYALRDQELAKVNKYVDPKTLEVLQSPRQP